MDNLVVDCMVRGRTLLLNYDDSKEYGKLYDPDVDQFFGTFRLHELMFQPQVFKNPEVWLPHVCNRKDLRLNPNFKLVVYSKFVIAENEWRVEGRVPLDSKRSSSRDVYERVRDKIESRFMQAFKLSNLEVIILE